MSKLIRNITKNLSKPLLFALWAAGGGLIAAILGELFLARALPERASPPAPQPMLQIDIMFVLDVTGSMGEEISGVQRGIQKFAQELSNKQLDAKVGLIAFGDRLNGEEPQVLHFPDSVFTSNPIIFSQQVGELIQVHGGDSPESSLDALSLAANQPFRPQSTKVVLLITDAPPKIPDLETRSLDEIAQKLERKKIDQLHLVIQPSEQGYFQPLQSASPGEIFWLSQTASGRQGFEKILPILGETIAETTVKGLQTNEEFVPESQNRLIIVISTWTAILAIGIALALIAGQNFYLRRKLLSLSEIFKGSSGSFIAGIVAGAAGQFIFASVSGIPLLVLGGRMAGWTLLGSLLGAGMSLFVPNLKTVRGIQGGTIGGGIGSIGFLILSSISGDIAGRLLGVVILGFFIGLMIALLEQLTRKAWLVVHWNEKENTIISLGEKPVILGTANHAHIYLSKAKGYYPETAKIIQKGEEILLEYNNEYANDKNMKKATHNLANGTRRKFGEILMEVHMTNESSTERSS